MSCRTSNKDTKQASISKYKASSVPIREIHCPFQIFNHCHCAHTQRKLIILHHITVSELSIPASILSEACQLTWVTRPTTPAEQTRIPSSASWLTLSSSLLIRPAGFRAYNALLCLSLVSDRDVSQGKRTKDYILHSSVPSHPNEPVWNLAPHDIVTHNSHSNISNSLSLTLSNTSNTLKSVLKIICNTVHMVLLWICWAC